MITPLRPFIFVATLFGLGFIVATPPIRFPDENGHYLRAAYVAANWRGSAPAERDAVSLRKAVVADLDYFSARAHEVMHGRPFDLAELITRVRPSRPEAGLASRSVPAAQMIPGTVGYIPQAIAYTIADGAGGTFLATVWAERLAVLLTSVLITALALLLMPAWARWTGVAVSLLPMAAYMRAALSPDAVVTAVTVLGISAFLNGAKRNDVTWLPSIVALAACAYLALVKPPYACILLLSLLWLPIRRRLSHPGAAIAVVAMMWAATFAAAAWHSSDVAYYVARIRPDLTPAEFATADKLHLLLTSPLAVGAVFAKTLLAAPAMVYSTIARFGWSDINPNPLLHALVIFWCAGVVYLDRRRIVGNLSLAGGAIMLLTFTAQVALVVATTWLTWTETASPMITGLQGRYFLPALLCGVLGGAVFVLRPFVPIGAKPGKTGTLSMPSFVTIGSFLLLGASLVTAALGEFYGIQGFNVICLHELCKPN